MFIAPAPAEYALVDEWLDEAFPMAAEVVGAPPFSFEYDGQPSQNLLQGFDLSVEETAEGRVLTYRDPATGLEITARVRRLAGFPAADWVLTFRNTGDADTPIIVNIQALDTAFALPRERGARVHHARGSGCAIDDFEPLVTSLNADGRSYQGRYVGQDSPVVIQTSGGRSSNGALPFFRLEMDDRAGVIGAVGWTGDVAMRFWRGDGGEVHAQGGMRRTHLCLHPGEEIRSPRILLLFFDGDAMRGHNLLRRLILAHYAPRYEGEVIHAPISLAAWGENRADRQVDRVRWIVDNGLSFDNFWIDAGWHGDAEYKDNSNVFNSGWGAQVGNWWPNKVSYPDGLSPIGEAAAAAGLRFTLWLEPERVFPDTQVTRDHPEWLLGPIGGNYLYNLGDPVAREALTDLVSSVLSEGQVTVYRQDFNMDPGPFFEAADTPDRIGMAEIRHIEGLYAYWDALRERHPGLLIDNCSSGGRRIDIETVSRSIPLWQSDFQCFPGFDPIGLQGQTHGLSLWVPLHTGGCDRPETYAFRSGLGPGTVFMAPANPTGVPEGYVTPWDAFPTEWIQRATAEQEAVRPYFEGDFYPLLAYSLADDGWAAWQWDRPDLGEGCVLALRRPRSPFAELPARLQGLDEDATYDVRDADTDITTRLSGRELAKDGMALTIDTAPGSSLLLYRRLDARE